MTENENGNKDDEAYSFHAQMKLYFIVSLILAGILFWLLDELEMGLRIGVSGASLILCFMLAFQEASHIEYLVVSAVILMLAFGLQYSAVFAPFPYYPIVTACIIGALIGGGGRVGRTSDRRRLHEEHPAKAQEKVLLEAKMAMAAAEEAKLKKRLEKNRNRKSKKLD